MKIDMSWTNKIVKFFGYAIYLIVSVVVLLEVIFRILPTSDSFKVKPVNTKNPILRYEENRDVRKQIGFNFQHITIKHINNYGYASDKDFQKKEFQTKPVIAVIGDSYVDALGVKNQDTFHAILDNYLQSYDVYPIGISGSPLSQYIAFSRYAAKQFSPKLYVFLIIANDFDESFEKVKNSPGLHYFNETDQLTFVEYNPSIMKRVARKSAFIRYLYLDLKITKQIKMLLKKKNISSEIQVRMTMDTLSNMDYLKLGREAINKFLDGVKNLTETSKVIILLDGDRSSIYAGMIQRDINKPVNILFDELMTLSKNIPNIDAIDLHNSFQENWSNENKKFNYDYDYHWNEYGHAVVAQVLWDKINN